jgi:hypothetical protein
MKEKVKLHCGMSPRSGMVEIDLAEDDNLCLMLTALKDLHRRSPYYRQRIEDGLSMRPVTKIDCTNL